MATALPIADKATLDAIKAIIDERLDKKISAISGGIDWSNKTFQTSCPSGTAETNTHLSITGSGYLVDVFNTATREVRFAIQIDGGPIFVVGLAGATANTAGSVPMFPIRFKNSLLITSDYTAGVAAHVNVSVILD